MPTIWTISLPTFLPFPGEQLRNSFPPNHDSLASMLGLCLAYLKVMHPTKLLQPDESMRASAHLINLLINEPLVQSLLPKGPHANAAPAKELNTLQIRLTSLENTLANLAKATTEARKEMKAHQTPSAPPARPMTQVHGPAPPTTYAAKAATPQRPSVVVETVAYTWPDNRRPLPADICATINAALDHSNTTQVRVSAARWTAKGNLVIWGGANTTAHQLTTALPHFSEALQSSLPALAESAPQSPPTLRHNVKWSKIRLNAVPTSKSEHREAYTPDEAHKALVTENTAYANLTITQKPSWVRDPSTYQLGATLSLSISFEDPDSTNAQTLLRQRTLYAFGHVITVKRWKQTPPNRAARRPAQSSSTTGPRSVPPAEAGPQPTVYTATTPRPSSQLSPEFLARSEHRRRERCRRGPSPT